MKLKAIFLKSIIFVFVVATCAPPGPPPGPPDGGPPDVGTPEPDMGSLDVNVTFWGTNPCAYSDRVWIQVENTSPYVYKHMVVKVRPESDPAPDWTSGWGEWPFFMNSLHCDNGPVVHFQNPNKLKPSQIGYGMESFIRDPGVSVYTLYYIICTWHSLSGLCSQGEFDFLNLQIIPFIVIEEIATCWLDPGPLSTAVDYLEPGMSAYILYRNQEASHGYFDLKNGSMCWMDMSEVTPVMPEGASPDTFFDLMAIPVMEINGNDAVNGDHSPESGMPIFDPQMFYFGNACAPNQVEVRYQVIAEDIFNVVMFYRLQDMDSGEKTEWTGVSMNPIGDDYYRQYVHAGNIPGAEMYANADFQVQFVVTNSEGGEILRSDVFSDMATLVRCGVKPPRDKPSPTPSPLPTPTPYVPK